MAMKKALVGLGIVSVLAPAAIAAMARDDGYVPRKAAEAISGLSLINLLGAPQQVEAQETALPTGRETSNLDSRVSRMLVRHAGLDLTFDGDGGLSEGEPLAAGSGGAAFAAASGSARQTSPRDTGGGQFGARSSAAGAGLNFFRGGGASSGAARGAGGSGGGLSGDGDRRVPQLNADEASLSDSSAKVRAGDEVPAAVPAPASVWMLLASIAGLAIGGRRRRSRSL